MYAKQVHFFIFTSKQSLHRAKFGMQALLYMTAFNTETANIPFEVK